MSDLDISRLQNRAYAKGYAAGLAAAREAVLGVIVMRDTSWDYRVAAVAAIDALEDTHITNITKEGEQL